MALRIQRNETIALNGFKPKIMWLHPKILFYRWINGISHVRTISLSSQLSIKSVKGKMEGVKQMTSSNHN